jgi:hypothetical protein
MPVIIMDVGRKPGGAFGAGGVSAAVGPLAYKGLDKAFSLAVGLGSVGAGVDMFDLVIAANRFDRVGVVARPVVGEDALHFNPVVGEERQGGFKEAGRGGFALVGQDLGEGQPGVIVDAHMHRITPDVAPLLGSVAGGPMARLIKAHQRLDVQVEQATGFLILVAPDRRRWRTKQAQAVKPVPI